MTNVLDAVSQIAIALFGLSSIFLIAKKNKWGFVLALIAQPFWFITTYIHEQWGIFALSFVYGGTWLYGFYQWFFTDNKKVEKKSDG